MIVDCEACDGEGFTAGRCLVPASFFQLAEHKLERCPECRGTGMSTSLSSDLAGTTLLGQLARELGPLMMRLRVGMAMRRATAGAKLGLRAAS